MGMIYMNGVMRKNTRLSLMDVAYLNHITYNSIVLDDSRRSNMEEVSGSGRITIFYKPCIFVKYCASFVHVKGKHFLEPVSFSY